MGQRRQKKRKIQTDPEFIYTLSVERMHGLNCKFGITTQIDAIIRINEQ